MKKYYDILSENNDNVYTRGIFQAIGSKKKKKKKKNYTLLFIKIVIIIMIFY